MRATRRSVRVGTVCGVVAAMFAGMMGSASTAGAGQSSVKSSALTAGQVQLETRGFVLLGRDGGVFPFSVPMAGAPASDPTRCPANVTDRNQPDGTCVSIALTPSGMGYWVLNGDTGKVYSYGTAGSYGEPASGFVGVSREFVPSFRQLVPTPSGRGFWVYEVGASDLGTVAHFGDAADYGDTISLVLSNRCKGFNGSPVGMAPTADGKGYWEVYSDGGVFAFGDAKFYGSTGAIHLARPIIGITASPTGHGYWLYAADGGVFAFGDAVFAGSTGGMRLNAPVVGMARNGGGPGYWLAAADGGVFAFGGAPGGSSIYTYGITLQSPIVAIASKNVAGRFCGIR